MLIEQSCTRETKEKREISVFVIIKNENKKGVKTMGANFYYKANILLYY